MGLLVEGTALPAEDLKEHLHYIRQHGILQFLNTWKLLKNLENDDFKFGDEIESGVFVVDPESKTVKLSLRGAEIRHKLSDKEALHGHETEGATWQPEFGAWMVESTPSRPYTGYTSDLVRVERNMILRRKRLLSALAENEISPTVTCFPLMGVGEFIHNPLPFSAPFSDSQCVPDYAINPHPRFSALARNIRMRRGSKVDIRVPLFRDLHTPEFNGTTAEHPFPEGYKAEPGHEIEMDCMAFGMGMCCLQVTFQARDCDESRYMYDQLVVLAPILLAMTAATPIFKGRLADIDARWTVISQSVDDRTPAERGLLSVEQAELVADASMVGRGITRIPKSRYDSVSTYIYHCEGDTCCHRTFAEYNDIHCPIDAEFKKQLRAEGVDENLAHHVAHLFVRDPLVAFAGKIEQNDEVSTDHFESIQSTNWQSCRWKPPPHPAQNKEHIGWRTEFRSMEVQLTDFENAAFTVFIILITRVILAFDLGLYIPLSKVDENMARAHHKDAITMDKFFFRKHIAPPEVVSGKASPVTEETASQPTSDSVEGVKSELEGATNTSHSEPEHFGCRSRNASLSVEDSFEEMTMEEIFLGKADYFPGLLPLVYAYLDYINCDEATYKRLSQYLKFIERRAKGELISPATWIRRFVTTHPDYKHDSIVPPSTAHDLMQACQAIGEGRLACPELLGDITIETIRREDAYGRELAGRLSHQQQGELVKKLIKRAEISRPQHVARGKSRTYTNEFMESERSSFNGHILDFKSLHETPLAK